MIFFRTFINLMCIDMKRIKYILAALVSVAFGIGAAAQSVTDINAAKALARSYGYSESEINSIMGQQGQEGGIQQPVPGEMRTVPADFLVNPKDSLTMLVPVEDSKKDDSNIYGHNFFQSRSLGFIPSFNVPAPSSYILGPGDELMINVWGASNANMVGTVSTSGSLLISGLGPVHVAGMTVSEAENVLKSRLGALYSGLRGQNPSTHMSVSMGRIKGITVNVAGEVSHPGAFNLPALCSVMSALYVAGGVKEIGSVRNIRIVRAGKVVATFDFYEFLENGDGASDVRLQDNDLVIVPAHAGLVTVEGEVRRDKVYEHKAGNTVADYIRFAGGMKPTAASDMVHIERLTLGKAYADEVTADRFDSYTVEPGDYIQVRANEFVLANKVSIKGGIMHAGDYSITSEIVTVKDLIEKAGGIKEGAFMDRAVVNRLSDDLMPEAVSFSVKDVMSGAVSIPLKREDEVVISMTEEIVQKTEVTVFGEVNLPGTFEYRKGMTLDDVVILAGGYTDGVDKTNVEVASRGRRTRGEVKRLNLVEEPSSGQIALQPYDMIFVRRLPHYKEQQTITVNGEVNYPGTYVIEKSTVRLSDIIERADGFTEDAYVRGARLTRSLTDEEMARLEVAMGIATQMLKSDTEKKNSRNPEALKLKPGEEMPEVAVDSTRFLVDSLDRSYSIGIDLQKAIDNPGSEFDVVLRTGDVINIPQMNNVVKISGEVFYPNTVVFNPKSTWRDYVNQAGGFTRDAHKSRLYVVYMNGMVAIRGSNSFKMEPGMEIVVPKKIKEVKDGMKANEIAALASSTSSLAYMAVALVNILKK